MKTYGEIAKVLRAAIVQRQVAQAKLREDAGVSQRTLTKVLSGQEDFRVSTLFALADRLGLELLLVPKDAVRTVAPEPVTAPAVKSWVQSALDRLATHVQGPGKKDQT